MWFILCFITGGDLQEKLLPIWKWGKANLCFKKIPKLPESKKAILKWDSLFGFDRFHSTFLLVA
jgi:hypothetical protein